MNAPTSPTATCQTCCMTKAVTQETWVHKHGKPEGRVCRVCARATRKAWAKANKAIHCALNTAWAAANAERVSASRRAGYPANAAKSRARSAAWRKHNPGAKLAGNRLRELAKAQRIPRWVDPEHASLIAEAYKLSALRTKLTGFKWHVDHVIPLRGKLVSGLHVIESLQVVPAALNLTKNNTYLI